jgi:hypothetical protein
MHLILRHMAPFDKMSQETAAQMNDRDATGRTKKMRGTTLTDHPSQTVKIGDKARSPFRETIVGGVAPQIPKMWKLSSKQSIASKTFNQWGLALSSFRRGMVASH